MASSQTHRPEDTTARAGSDACSTTTDPSAPAGSKNSLGAKSDCNGRPTTDDSVVEAMDEMGPLTPEPDPKTNDDRH
ncbi:MAG TPA: hypothetical protein VHZ25_08720 [Acidobacteriaceae bacterium]|jgi:hypothetical protein|nr:hypothetical protein [Acidobacteriaceae bacterium]